MDNMQKNKPTKLYAVAMDLEEGFLLEAFTNKQGAEIWKETYAEQFMPVANPNGKVEIEEYYSVNRLKTYLEDEIAKSWERLKQIENEVLAGSAKSERAKHDTFVKVLSHITARTQS